MSRLKDSIVLRAKQLGFELVKITDAHPLWKTRGQLRRSMADGFYSPLAKGDCQERTTPTLLLPGALSVIVVAMAYNVEPAQGLGLGPVDEGARREGRGELSRYCRGEDYHGVLQPRLQLLADYIGLLSPGAISMAMVDTGPLAEKALAYRAGVGVWGWNSCLITEGWGSWVFLGALITTLALEPDPCGAGKCQECGRCLEACPTGAIVAPYVIDANRCLAQITQSRGIIPRQFRAAMGTRLFGCDTCQAVCPLNDPQQIAYSQHRQFRPRERIGAYPLLSMVATMDHATFNATFRHTAAGWRGPKVLRRNALIGLGNLGDPQAIPLLHEALSDSAAAIKTAALWSLGEIGRRADDDVKRRIEAILRQARAKEKDPLLVEEVQAAYEALSSAME